MVFRGLRRSRPSIAENLYIVYVDESGTPGIKKGRYYILFGLAAPLTSNHMVMELGANILNNLKQYGYNNNEIKGSKIFKLLKNEIDKYVNIIDNVVGKLEEFGVFSVSIVIDKINFAKNVLPKLRKSLDSALAKPPVGYLNVLLVPKIRNEIINSIINKHIDLIIRAQSINELLVRIQKEFEHRESYGIVIFDSEASSLASSAYGIFAEALRREGLAYVKGGLGKPDRILHVSLTQSNLDYGIQLADLLVNSLYNCIEHNIVQVYKKLSNIFLDKGIVILPKGVELCR